MILSWCAHPEVTTFCCYGCSVPNPDRYEGSFGRIVLFLLVLTGSAVQLTEYKRLHAEWYDLVSAQVDQAREIDFWLDCIQQAGQPVLELGCGTGRVLTPLLERGIDAIGIDVSTPMLDRCRATCSKKNLSPELYEQSMLEFDLPYEFSLIMLTSGGLGLFVRDDDIQSVFERVYAHLKPGGLFVYEFELPPLSSSNADRSASNSLAGPDGTTLNWHTQRSYDPNARIWESIFLIDKSRGGEILESEVNERTGRYFDREEAERYATAASFTEVIVTGWLTADTLAGDENVATVRATKPE